MYPTAQPSHFARRLVVIFILLIAAVGLLFLTTMNRTSTMSVNFSQQISSDASLAAPAADGKLVVAQNGQFILYDPTSGQDTSMGPQTPLDLPSNPDSLQFNGDLLLFHTNYIAGDSQLTAILKQYHYKTSLDYWWLFNINSQSIKPLPSGTLLARFDGSQIAALRLNNSGEAVNYYSTGLKELNSITIPNSLDFLPTPYGILLQTANNQVLYTEDGIVNKSVVKSGSLIGVDQASNQAMISEKTGSNQSLVRVDLSTLKLDTIDKSIGGQTAWNPAGIVLFNHVDGSADNITHLSVYNVSNHKLTNWQVSSKGLGSGVPVVALSASSGLIQTIQQKYYLLGTEALSNQAQNL